MASTARALNDTANAARKAAQPLRIKPQKSNKIGRSRTICRSRVPHLPRGEVARLFIGFDALGSFIAASQLSPAPLTIEERLAESGVASFFRVARASVCVPVALANLLAHLQGRALNNQRDTPPNSTRSQSSSSATHKSCHRNLFAEVDMLLTYEAKPRRRLLREHCVLISTSLTKIRLNCGTALRGSRCSAKCFLTWCGVWGNNPNE